MKTLIDIVPRQPDSAFTRLLRALDVTQQIDAAYYLRLSERVSESENLHRLTEETGMPNFVIIRPHCRYLRRRDVLLQTE